jgi:hypothetical protein
MTLNILCHAEFISASNEIPKLVRDDLKRRCILD